MIALVLPVSASSRRTVELITGSPRDALLGKLVMVFTVSVGPSSSQAGMTARSPMSRRRVASRTGITASPAEKAM